MEKYCGCGKFLCKDTWKKSSMFWLKNWSYLVASYFFKQIRITPENLENLLAIAAPRIMKSSLHRWTIEPREKLCITLSYLISGESRDTITASYGISPVTVSRIINKTSLEYSRRLYTSPKDNIQLRLLPDLERSKLYWFCCWK